MPRRGKKITDGSSLDPLGAVIIGAAVFIALLPLYWLISTSFKPMVEWLASPPVWLTTNPTLDNFIILFWPESIGTAAYGGFVGQGLEKGSKVIMDSAITAGTGTLLSIVVGMLAAFAISRHRIGGNFMAFFILSARMFPPVVVVIPMVILYATIGLYDTYLGLIMLYATFTLPYSVWMIKSFIDDIPVELEESAMIDGLSKLEANFRVTFPLIRGGIVATALFVLILNWSEFLFALTLTHRNVITIPVQTAKYVAATGGTLYGVQAALGLVSIIPLIVFGYIIQRHLITGLTFGAVKR